MALFAGIAHVRHFYLYKYLNIYKIRDGREESVEKGVFSSVIKKKERGGERQTGAGFFSAT